MAWGLGKRGYAHVTDHWHGGILIATLKCFLCFLLYGSVRLCALVQFHDITCICTVILRVCESVSLYQHNPKTLWNVFHHDIIGRYWCLSHRSEKSPPHTPLLHSRLGTLRFRVLLFVACMYVFNILTISTHMHTRWRSMLLILQTGCLGNPEV